MYGVAKGSRVEVVKEGESEFVAVEKVVPKMKVMDPLSKREREVLIVSSKHYCTFFIISRFFSYIELGM